MEEKGCDKLIVIDNGSYSMKAGFGGDTKPDYITRTIIGRPGSIMGKQYAGDQTWDVPGLNKRFPIQHGIVTNWEDMTEMWRHCFAVLGVAPEEHAVFLTDGAPGIPKAGREKCTQIMFEDFGVPAMFIQLSQTLSMLSTGATEGIVLEVGHGVTYTVPMFEGYYLPHATLRVDLGGQDVSQRLLALLGDSCPFTSVKDIETLLPRVKESLCYVTLDRQQEDRDIANSPSSFKKEYILPNGDVITLNSERYYAPEILFDPSLVGTESSGVAETLYHSIMKCDVDLRAMMYSNIVLGGGGTMFAGMVDRIEKELKMLAPSGRKICIKALPERIYSAWLGASALSSLSSFEWATKEEYDESGPCLIHRKSWS